MIWVGSQMYSMIAIAGLFVFANALALFWLHSSGQANTLFEKALRGLLIFLRIALIFVIAFCVFSQLLGFSLPTTAWVLGIVTVLSCSLSVDHPPNVETAVEMAVFLVLISPFVFCREFALGFPLRSELQLPPQPDNGEPESLDHLIDERAEAVSALRPTGTIRHMQREYSARTQEGEFLARGTQVKISAIGLGVVFVTEECEEAD